MPAVTAFWERQPTETDDAWQGYLAYCARRLHTVSDPDLLLERRAGDTAGRWARQYQWDRRAAVFDAELIRRRALAAAEEVSLAGEKLVSLAAAAALIADPGEGTGDSGSVNVAQISEIGSALAAGLALMSGALDLVRDAATPDADDRRTADPTPDRPGPRSSEPRAETPHSASSAPADPDTESETDTTADPRRGGPDPVGAAETGTADRGRQAADPEPGPPRPVVDPPRVVGTARPKSRERPPAQPPNPAEPAASPKPRAGPAGSSPAAAHDPGTAEPAADTEPAAAHDPGTGHGSSPAAAHYPGPGHGSSPAAAHDPRTAEPAAAHDPGPGQPAAAHDPGPGPDAGTEPAAAHDPGPGQPAAAHDPGTGPDPDAGTEADPPNRRRAAAAVEAPTITERCGKRGGRADHRTRGERNCELCDDYGNRRRDDPAAVIYPTY